MHDHTIDQLRELDADRDDFRSSLYGPKSKALAEHRDALAADAERTARDADAPIRNARAIMLLFDVLVGITLGVLAHDQRRWAYRTECGTAHCIAGWLVHIGSPLAVTRWGDLGPNYPMTASTVRVDGEIRGYDELAATLLGVEFDEYPDDDDLTTTHPVAELFDAENSLADLWRLAGEYTGGAITVPTDLAARVSQ